MSYALLILVALGSPPSSSNSKATSAEVSMAPVASLEIQANTKINSDSQTPNQAPEQCQSKITLNKKSRSLQRNLENAINKTHLDKYLKKHRLSIALVDLTSSKRIYYAGINDDDMMYAASLPKIAILLANAQAADDGRLDWTDEHSRRFFSMITASSNADASWGVEQVSLGSIESVLRDPRYCLYDNEHGGLWIGRKYAHSSETYRDPKNGLIHGATARQAARFYTMLNQEKLVSKVWSDRMLSLMGPPKHHHKFVRGLADRQNIQFVARKSGTWKVWHSDSALIRHGDNLYVAVAISETRHGDEIMQKIIRILDDLVMNGKHRRQRRPSRV
ncbi:MAG: serine hydrolase [Deltaproteobacteria bacterium]|nr:serine hydrolase [Deltaproteobacteria bacterium]